MTDRDAYQDDMERIVLRSGDKIIERVLEGTYDGPNQGLVDLSRELGELPSALDGGLDEDTQQAHIAAMMLEAQLSAGTTPMTSVAHHRRGPFAVVGAKIALVAAGLLVFAGILAVTGSLPRPVQAAVSHTVERIGIHIPDGEPTKQLPPSTEGSPAQAVQDVISIWKRDVVRDLNAEGCEFGHAVARAAGENPGRCRDKAGGPVDKGRPDHVRTGKQEGTPNGPPVSTGKPDNVKTGKQEGTPTGPPQGSGRPDNVKTGPPDGTPDGPPPEPGPPQGSGDEEEAEDEDEDA